MAAAAKPAVIRLDRNVTIAAGVVLFHVAALWALNTGLLRRAVEVIVPVEMLSEVFAPPAPKPDPVPQPQPAEPIKKQPIARKPERVVTPEPQPVVVPDQRPAPNAPAAAPAPPVAATAVPAPPPAPAKVELPYSNADYLQNPKPAYPALSRRLGEQGRVELRVFIAADGTPQRADVVKSSGFDRLDQAAVATVLKWRFVPGKRGGVPEPAWANVPIDFVLEQ